MAEHTNGVKDILGISIVCAIPLSAFAYFLYLESPDAWFIWFMAFLTIGVGCVVISVIIYIILNWLFGGK